VAKSAGAIDTLAREKSRTLLLAHSERESEQATLR
jgi:hypothetical protein